MITYELAKKLKDAGFPLKCSQYGTEDWVFGVVIKDGESIMYPLLGELIEACGEEFFSLQKGTLWRANTPGSCNEDYKEVFGSTPEEAVANLWLALNKHE